MNLLYQFYWIIVLIVIQCIISYHQTEYFSFFSTHDIVWLLLWRSAFNWCMNLAVCSCTSRVFMLLCLILPLHFGAHFQNFHFLWFLYSLIIFCIISKANADKLLHNHFTALWILSRTSWVSQYQKSKPVWISWSKWQWVVVAPRPRQITTSAPHHSVFYRPDALPAA